MNVLTVLSTKGGNNITWNTGTNKFDCDITQYEDTNVLTLLNTTGVTGGLKVEDTGNDLAIICAIMSSNNDINIPENYCFAGEVGLSGEIRPVNRINQRIKEAEKLGFSKIFISKYCDIISSKKIEIVYLAKIEDLIEHIS